MIGNTATNKIKTLLIIKTSNTSIQITCKWIVTKFIRVGWVLHLWLLKGTHFVCLEAFTMLVNNLIDIFLESYHYFILFVTIKYWWILSIPFFIFSFSSPFVKSFFFFWYPSKIKIIPAYVIICKVCFICIQLTCIIILI